MPPSGSSRRTTLTGRTQRDVMTAARERPPVTAAHRQHSVQQTPQSVAKGPHRNGNWGGRIGVATEPPRSRRKPSERHPAGYAEKPLVIWGMDCTALWHEAARNEMKRLTRHLPHAQQAVARAYVEDCTVGGHYYWSQTRLGNRAGVRRETTNRALRRLGADLEILQIPKKLRGYNNPKTLTLSAWFLGRVMKAVMRALSRGLGHTRKAKPSVETSGAVGLPSYREFLRQIRGPKHRYGGGVMIRCAAHDDHTPSLSVGEGRDGKLLLHCHAGCSHEAVRQALGLPPPKAPVTLRTRQPWEIGRVTSKQMAERAREELRTAERPVITARKFEHGQELVLVEGN
jgi:hypothetical protein